MKEDSLLYYYPFRVDKEMNLRHYANKDKEFVRLFIPNYDGTNIDEFLTEKSNLNQKEIADFRYAYMTYRNWSEWYKYGKNMFSFSEELLQMLVRTDASEITPDNFHLPYDTFYLSLKPLGVKISDDSEEIIEGVYIDHNIWNPAGEHPEGYCDLSFSFAGNFQQVFDRFLPQIKSRLEYNSDGDYDEYPHGSFWNVWLYFEKKEGRETVKQAIDYFIAELKKEIFPKSNMESLATDYELDFFNSTLKLLEKTLNLVVNCLLYLSQPTDKKDIELKLPKGLPSNFEKKLSFAKTTKETKKLENKIESLGFTKIHFVGQTFKKSSNEISNTYSVLTHWRRGHWRNQKFGKDLKDSKIIWILPTIVNSDKGEPLKGHIYDLNE